MEQIKERLPKSLIFIGNGFDVAHGRKTKYVDFYNGCGELKTMAAKGNSLCEHILANVKGELWQDLGCGLYEYSRLLTKKYEEGNIIVAEKFKSEYNDLRRALFYYLEKEQNRSIDKDHGHCVDLLFSEWKKTNFRIVSFNYTFCVANYTLPSERKYELNVDIDKLIYQHGSINNIHRGGYNVKDSIVLGIDDSQRVEEAHSFLYKSHQNTYDRRSLIKLMNDSEIFIIYGCSMGPSDDFYFHNIFKEGRKKNFIIYGYGDDDLGKIKRRVCYYSGGLPKFKINNRVFFVDSKSKHALSETKKALSIISC